MIQRRGVLYITIFFLLGIGVAFFIDKFFVHERNDYNCDSDYNFITAYPDCETFEKKAEKLSKLQGELEKKISDLEREGEVSRVAVFSRDLETRRFVGVNENQQFYMASLLKVPLAIAWFKLAEVEPKVLLQNITYNGKPDLYYTQNIPIEERLVKGKIYSINELIYRSLVYSDNTASQILFDNLPEELIDRILTALTLEFEKLNGINENIVTARSYASVFRTLYNSSYLTREYSDKILEILSHSKYKDAAVAGVPNDILISHKFGERTYASENGEIMKQLHDCGIVYAKNGKEPYSFCILSEGRDFEKMKKSIKEVSEIIFNNIGKD